MIKQQRTFGIHFFRIAAIAAMTFTGIYAGPHTARADGCFVVPKFVWDKHKDINEPTQKAIIVYDKGREEMLLQVKYEGPAEEFGWLVPVPNLPKVERGSMQCFYELSKLSQERFDLPQFKSVASLSSSSTPEPVPVTVVEVKTVGAYEIAVLTAKDANSLTQWLEQHQFAFPKEKSEVIDSYLKRNWYFIAARIQLGKGDQFEIVSGTPKTGITKERDLRQKLASGELHPLLISFDTEKCIYPLKISSINGRSSEVQIYTLSAETLMEPRLFDNLLAELNRTNPDPRAKWEQNARTRLETIERLKNIGTKGISDRFKTSESADPAERERMEKVRKAMEERRALLATTSRNELQGKPPEKPKVEAQLDDVEYTNMLSQVVVSADVLPECVKQFPRLKGKSWTLVKNTRTFAPEQMEDLEFVPAAKVLAARLNNKHAFFVLHQLQQLGNEGVPAILDAIKSTNELTRFCAASVLPMAGERAEAFRHIDGQRYDTLHPDPRLVTAAKELIDSNDPVLRAKGLEAALDHWDPSFAPMFLRFLSDKDEETRRIAIGLGSHLAQTSPEFSTIVDLLHSTNAEAQASAVLIVSCLNYAIPREQWASILKNPHVEASAGIVARMRGGPLTRGELSALLQNPTPMARMIALKQIGRSMETSQVDLLLPLLNDPVELVRNRTGKVLQQLTKQTFDYKEVDKWNQWWKANKEKFQRKD